MSSETQDWVSTAPQPEIPHASGRPGPYILAVSSMHVAGSCTVNQTAFSAASSHPEFAKPLGGSTKRVVDVAIAVTTIILLAPAILIIMGLIKLVMGRPIFFGHTRVGYRGKPFRCYKFRTMVTDAEEALARHLARDPEAAQEWRETRKLKNDPRVTFVGRLLRKSRLDELPQLINVLRGEMSCVGPRPIVASELERYGPNATEYLRARPGLTGIWQVSGRNGLDYADRVALDGRYVQNWSLWNDFVILGRTVFVVLKFHETA
jgi:exopolysaccharide production protein ExoY